MDLLRHVWTRIEPGKGYNWEKGELGALFERALIIVPITAGRLRQRRRAPTPFFKR